MSYLVLARKYRPQTFDEIVGQEHVTQTLKNAIASGRLHHAFLFTGARGFGRDPCDVWRDVRVAEGARLEIVCIERYRGFESLSLRRFDVLDKFWLWATQS